ncbi:hypothetical protein GOP47_0011989 [Adiantum capillus-veneris]|uniref:Pentatricopeptide repeat-containing protein n=1 Tax=Adiantum capillus-veneris TaxID=13818 RepID=A0A9D4ZIB2_ADICA|nr:hypothetical protein GOP47_0011989 [Adiantum capillus-veneris]
MIALQEECSAQKQEGQQRGALKTNHTKSQNISIVAALKVCATQRDLCRGSRLHADIIQKGLLETNIFIGSCLISLYVKCGALEKAQHVFNELLVRDSISWNALIAGYAQHERSKQALDCFEQMQLEGFSPTAVSFACALKACGSIEDIDKGHALHAQIVIECSIEEHIVVANALIDMYAKCGTVSEAQEVFDELQNRDVVTWNVLIAGYAQLERANEAFECFEQMQIAGFLPDVITFPSILKACSVIGALDKGEELHRHLVKERLVQKDAHIGTALVDMYAKCGALEKAQEVFDGLPKRDVVLWNALISGYAQHKRGEEALNKFHDMQLEGFSPSAVTFACLLTACGSMEALDKGQEVHAHIVRDFCLENDVYVGTGLVDMYAKCGALEEAQVVFDELQSANVVSWNALIGGYVQHGFGDKALGCFHTMHLEGFSPDTITFVCLLKACGSTGAACIGQALHSQIASHGLAEYCEIVGNALVDMYANCGMLAEAQEIFDNLYIQDVIAWSALMVGFSQLGEDKVVFHLFGEMIAAGVEPDLVTYSVILNTCSHNGLPEKGESYFGMISKVHGRIPTLEHHACMIDLFGRIGHLETVVAMIEEMPFSADGTVWHTFLGACRFRGDTKLGRWAFGYAVQEDDEVDAAYVSLGDLYAVTNRQEGRLNF